MSRRADGRRRGLRQHPGFEALRVAIDDHSRLAFTQMLPDKKANTTFGFPRDAVDFYARHGIRNRALLIDNGSNYHYYEFRSACGVLETNLILGGRDGGTKAGLIGNGEAERFTIASPLN